MPRKVTKKSGKKEINDKAVEQVITFKCLGYSNNLKSSFFNAKLSNFLVHIQYSQNVLWEGSKRMTLKFYNVNGCSALYHVDVSN